MLGAAGLLDLNQTRQRPNFERLLTSRRNRIRDGKCCRRPRTSGGQDDIRRRFGFRPRENGEGHAGGVRSFASVRECQLIAMAAKACCVRRRQPRRLRLGALRTFQSCSAVCFDQGRRPVVGMQHATGERRRCGACNRDCHYRACCFYSFQAKDERRCAVEQNQRRARRFHLWWNAV